MDPGTAWRDFPGPHTIPGWTLWHTPLELHGLTAATIRLRTFFDFIVPPGIGPSSRIYTNVALYLLTELSDGAIVYLNGTEVFRYNLPAGPVTNGTYTGLPPSVFGYVRADIDPGLLDSTNSNLIAVQMHQNQPDSETFLFDLVLVGMIEPSFPELRIKRMDDHLALQWDEFYWHSVRAEHAATLDGPWSPLDEIPSHITIHPDTQRFFRLRWVTTFQPD